MVVLFGIFMGEYSLYGTASSIVLIPVVIIGAVGVGFAAKRGMKKMLIDFTIYDLAMYFGCPIIGWIANLIAMKSHFFRSVSSCGAAPLRMKRRDI